MNGRLFDTKAAQESRARGAEHACTHSSTSRKPNPINEIEKLREALEFYAYPGKSSMKGRWNDEYPGGITYQKGTSFYCDTGAIAREALSRLESEQALKTVPMAMLKEANALWSMDKLRASNEDLIKLAARYGYIVEED